MASTEAQVCNLALARIGQREFIDALDEATAEAQVCRVVYADSRDAVLAAFPWAWATRRAVLGRLAGVSRTGWAYAFALPEDCIAARYVHPGMRQVPAELRIPFAVEGGASGAAGSTTNTAVLLADIDAPELVYTARVVPPVLFPPLFTQALVWKLAMELALALPVKPQVASAMEAGYRRALAEAAAADMRQGQEDAPPEGESIRAR